MSSADPTPPPAPEPVSPETEPTTTGDIPGMSRKRALLYALLGAIPAWLLLHAYGAIPHPSMSEEYLKEAAEKYTALHTLSPHLLAEREWKRQIDIHRNSALAFGLAGLALGVLFGALARREYRTPGGSAVKLLCKGALIGALTGTAAGLIGAQVSRIAERLQYEPQSAFEMRTVWIREMYTSIAIHASEWCLIGLAMGFIMARYGHPARSMARSLGMGFGGALIGAAAFTPLTALLFPASLSRVPVPEATLNRLLFVLLPVIAITLLLTQSSGKGTSAATESD